MLLDSEMLLKSMSDTELTSLAEHYEERINHHTKLLEYYLNEQRDLIKEVQVARG